MQDHYLFLILDVTLPSYFRTTMVLVHILWVICYRLETNEAPWRPNRRNSHETLPGETNVKRENIFATDKYSVSSRSREVFQGMKREGKLSWGRTGFRISSNHEGTGRTPNHRGQREKSIVDHFYGRRSCTPDPKSWIVAYTIFSIWKKKGHNFDNLYLYFDEREKMRRKKKNPLTGYFCNE
jgi:hypothetical protein